MNAALPGDAALLAGAALLVVGVLLSGFADRFRAPGLLLFLGLGMLLGDDGLAFIRFSDAEAAQRIGVVALVVILFEGGLSTSVTDVRRVAAPAALLATVGVVVTALVVAGGVLLITDTSPTTALLIGAVVASTDAAAVFAVLRRAPTPRRLNSLLETESGGNDPMAVLLTVGVLASWSGDPDVTEWALFGARQLGGGLVVGLAVGAAGSFAVQRLRLDSAALYPVLALGLAGLAYGAGAGVGASGFLAVYVTGLVLGSTAPRQRRSIRRFHEGLASVSQIALFLLLGLLVFPAQLPAVAITGLATAGVLIFLARPLAVLTCLPWFGFDRRELTFSAWAGLRGAVPIVLATFPLIAGYPDGDLVFNVVFFVVLVSAALQGLTVGPLARALGLEAGTTAWDAVADLVSIDSAGVDVVELEITSSCGVAGRTLREVPLPGTARVAAVLRDDGVRVPDGNTRLAPGDLLIVVTASDAGGPALLTAWAEGPRADPLAPPPDGGQA
ncbi:MAG TPA: potassium/proton antiporter [Acidimicrobiales bacterium]|nr:potassium/proton antiporter [Acidimicrobiales bacterium]